MFADGDQLKQLVNLRLHNAGLAWDYAISLLQNNERNTSDCVWLQHFVGRFADEARTYAACLLWEVASAA